MGVWETSANSWKGERVSKVEREAGDVGREEEEGG